jgi:hypothetical protein
MNESEEGKQTGRHVSLSLSLAIKGQRDRETERRTRKVVSARESVGKSENVIAMGTSRTHPVRVVEGDSPGTKTSPSSSMSRISHVRWRSMEGMPSSSETRAWVLTRRSTAPASYEGRAVALAASSSKGGRERKEVEEGGEGEGRGGGGGEGGGGSRDRRGKNGVNNGTLARRGQADTIDVLVRVHCEEGWSVFGWSGVGSWGTKEQKSRRA